MNDGKYAVRSKTARRLIFWFGLVLFSLLFAGITYLHLFSDAKEAVSVICFEYAASLLFIILCVLGIYREKRPRVEVSGEQVIVYPRWKKKKTLHFSDITSYKTNVRYAQTLLFGVVGYAANGGDYGSFFEYTYFSDNEPVITVDSRMANAYRFENDVKRQIRIDDCFAEGSTSDG